MPEAMPEARQAETIVTSETLAEFQAKQLDLKEPPTPIEEPEPEEKKEPEVKNEEIKAEEEKTDEKQEKKDNPKLQKRFSELTEQRKAAEAKAERERVARESAERERDELKAKLNPQKTEDVEPKRDQYASDEEYSKALVDHRVDAKLKERDKQEAEKKNREEQERRVTTWQERVKAAKAELPDYQEKIEAAKVMVSDQVRDAIFESDIGPQILYHFAEHPEEAERIGKLTVGGALKAIGKLEAKLEKIEKEPEKPESKSPVSAAVAEVSKAPDPIAPLKGANKPVESRVVNGEYKGTYDQYKKDRASGKIK